MSQKSRIKKLKSFIVTFFVQEKLGERETKEKNKTKNMKLSTGHRIRPYKYKKITKKPFKCFFDSLNWQINLIRVGTQTWSPEHKIKGLRFEPNKTNRGTSYDPTPEKMVGITVSLIDKNMESNSFEKYCFIW